MPVNCLTAGAGQAEGYFLVRVQRGLQFAVGDFVSQRGVVPNVAKHSVENVAELDQNRERHRFVPLLHLFDNDAGWWDTERLFGRREPGRSYDSFRF